MHYQEALSIVKGEFETFQESSHNEIILTGLTYDGSRGFCVSLYDEGERVILTDLGETKDVFDEVGEDEWTTLCQKSGFAFRHWHIEREFFSLDDLYAFIRFLDEISDLYFPIDD